MMDNLQEDNPLQTQSDTIATRVVIKRKNNVGRPKKKTEIKFSPQPKSIISEFLCNERKNLLENPTQVISSRTLIEEKNKRTCEDCSDGNLYSASDYNEHILMHTNKFYKCDYENCTYVTKFSSNLTTHKRIHTSERPYACDECTFRTNFINSLKSHKRLHRAELPFACKYCKYKCNSGSNLKKHCTRKHLNNLKK